MKIFAIVSAILLVVLGVPTAYLGWQHAKERARMNQVGAAFRVRQEAAFKSRMEALQAASKATPGAVLPGATPMGSQPAAGSPAPKVPAPPGLPATPAP